MLRFGHKFWEFFEFFYSFRTQFLFQTNIVAPHDGEVSEVYYQVGEEGVPEFSEVVEIVEEEEEKEGKKSHSV